MEPSSSRILYDVPCVVCLDHSSGKHYGVYACDGCAGFFKRSVRRDRQYACKARAANTCLVDKAHRNQCRACRLTKCLNVGMNRDAVQHERGPRNSTICRQMAMFMKDPAINPSQDFIVSAASHTALNLTQPKHFLLPPPPTNIYPNVYSPLDRVNIMNCFPPISSPKLCWPSLIPDVICEAAASILFMNIKWTRIVPAFTCLSLSDRLLLLEDSWRDLFVLGAAQFLYPLNLRVLLNENSRIDMKQIESFEEIMRVINGLKPDDNEYCCLRAISLFRTNAISIKGADVKKRFQDIPSIAVFQDQGRLMLKQYTNQTYPGNPSRLTQLFQLLPVFNQVSATTIEELFFRTTIADIPIETIIGNIYKSD